jgi:hypothetical protein
MIESSCHCGAVRLKIARAPEEVIDCNCSICRRYGALWAYYSPKDVQVTKGATEIYMRGQKTTEFHRCKQCGCVTHWALVDRKLFKRKDGSHYSAEEPRSFDDEEVEKPDRMGVNARLMEPEVLARVRVRRLDGANSWKYLD